MLKEFNEFINDKPIYRLYIENDNNTSENIDWDITLDFSDIWEKYQKKDIDLETYIKNFKLKVNDYKDKILEKKDTNIWNELVIILNDFKQYDINTMHKRMDDIYDWGDKNNINIKT